LSWDGSGPGWFVDISRDQLFSGYSNKKVDNASSTWAPDNFSLGLTLQPDVTYYWRVWDTQNESITAILKLPSCSGGGGGGVSPSPSITPTDCDSYCKTIYSPSAGQYYCGGSGTWSPPSSACLCSKSCWPSPSPSVTNPPSPSVSPSISKAPSPSVTAQPTVTNPPSICQQACKIYNPNYCSDGTPVDSNGNCTCIYCAASPTVTNTPTTTTSPTVTSTTGQPTNTLTTTPGNGSNSSINISISLVGIGGNTGIGENPTPVSNTKPGQYQITDALTGQTVSNSQVTLNFDSQSFTFKTPVPNLAPGIYNVKVRVDNSLWKFAGTVNLTANQTKGIQTVALVSGDLNQDNVMDLADYNALLGCMQGIGCGDGSHGDLDMNGRVDGADLNIFYSGLAKRQGD
jgi:hypothetical protein